MVGNLIEPIILSETKLWNGWPKFHKGSSRFESKIDELSKYNDNKYKLSILYNKLLIYNYFMYALFNIILLLYNNYKSSYNYNEY